MDGNGNIEQRGQVTGYSLQLMHVIQQMLGDGSGSSSSTAAPQLNPGSRASRRAARNQRMRKLNKKGGK